MATRADVPAPDTSPIDVVVPVCNAPADLARGVDNPWPPEADPEPVRAAAFGPRYGEENEFCPRTARAGYRNVLCDDAFALHRGSTR